jgi:mono/diheme cytochrome c family protein
VRRRRSWNAAGIAAALLLACDSSSAGSAPYQAFTPGIERAERHRGEVLYNSYCISCHGRNGRGEGLGPRLLDTLYTPARLPDEAIYAAVQNGVNRKHWNFGAMPKVQRIGRPEVGEIIPYIRWLQQRAGLIDSASAGGS